MEISAPQYGRAGRRQRRTRHSLCPQLLVWTILTFGECQSQGTSRNAARIPVAAADRNGLGYLGATARAIVICSCNEPCSGRPLQMVAANSGDRTIASQIVRAHARGFSIHGSWLGNYCALHIRLWCRCVNSTLVHCELSHSVCIAFRSLVSAPAARPF